MKNLLGSDRQNWLSLPQKLASSNFIRNAAIVGTGAAIGQLATILSSPILTRLYDPAIFGIFGTFTAFTGPIAAAICLKYDNAIVLEADDQKAVDTASLCWLVAVLITVLFYCLLLIGRVQISSKVGSAGTDNLLIFAAPFLLSSAGFSIGTALSTRSEHFKLQARYQTRRSVSTVIAQVLLGLIHPTATFLTFGQMIGQLTGLSAFIHASKDKTRRSLVKLDVAGIRSSAARNRSFAVYSAPQAVVNSLASSLPLILLSQQFGPSAVGFFWLAFRILTLPGMLIAESVRNVFYKKVASLTSQGQRITSSYRKMAFVLGMICLPICLVLIVGGPAMFSLIFGARWRVSGVFAQAISVQWLLSICSVAASVVVPAIKKQRSFLTYECLSICLRAAAFLIVGSRYDSTAAVLAYSTTGAIITALWLFYIDLSCRKFDDQAQRSS